MLINATQAEELRMAMVDGQRLYDLNIELPASERKKANIYKGKITRIEPSLEAAFVEYGSERHGFLPLKEISSEYFIKPVDSGKKPNIKEVLKEGQDIVVQIDKEERGNKGAALTTFVSLAGRFIVLKPNKPRSGGVSRRIVGSDRDLARDSLSEIDIPKGMSVILRTAGIDRSAEELSWDLENLLTIWQAILNVVLERPSPFLIYRESNAVVRALRDYLSNEIGEILIDDEQTYNEAAEFMQQVMPHNLRKLKHYTDPVPLFTRFQIETQIESAFSHSVTLPSGGSLVIDHTEALVSIDINSARATKGGDIEATALNTNLEAAEEIARQLRIRDLGGLIVIDFIDMGPQKHQRDVENRLRDAVRQDRARVQIGKISRFGLLEMSRQRLRPSLGESSYLTCPRCSGIGTIRSVESLALAILRIIGEEARKERTPKVIAQLPVEVATYLLNEKRDWVRNLEARHGTQVILVANPALETPHYAVRRVRDDQTELPENVGVSYELAEQIKEPELPAAMQERKAAEEAAIGVIKPSRPAPLRELPKEPKKGLWASFVAFFKGDGGADEDKKPRPQKAKQPRKSARKTDKDSARSDKPRSKRRKSDAKQDGEERQAKRGGKRKVSKKASKKKTQSKQRDTGEQETKPQDAAEQADDSKDTTKKPARARRSRGGRRRRRSGDRPAEQAAEQETQSAPAKSADTKKSAASGPPRARTDAERETGSAKPGREPSVDSGQALAAKPEQGTPGPARPESKPAADATPGPKPEPKPAAEAAPKPEPKPEPKPAAEAAPKPEPKPEPKPAAEAPPKPEPKPEPKPAAEAAPKPEPKPEPKPAAEAPPKPESKSEPEPARQAADDSKPGGRLLPWDAPPATPVEKTKPAAPSEG
jgi:ribonuclease E